ncbi:TOX high mobility group box family member 4b isoform X2 [Rhinichthys klamathensis goyatoka]|uniref:TOX high mobility group box family member 4b isoform X2 n=1 Tax=Rhinichthys klamathensis goyatoka TaxID=3034132 RepID=UPI0024B4C4AC|nr:TOX high mobility group box family member 4b isoform X2 [Rhinichthys klamathensis goyatoka]
MDLNFYADLSDGSGNPGDPEFLDPQAFNGFDAVQKFPGGNDNFLSISDEGHHFLSSSEVRLSTFPAQIQHAETFHTPSLGDEEFEIPPISLDPDSLTHTLTHTDSALGVSAHFGEGSGVPGNAVVGGNDPSFASTFVSAPAPLEHLSLMDLGHPIGSQFSSSSPMTIDVPLSDMNHGLLGHNQLTTIDQSELSAQLGLSLGGGAILPRPQSPDQPLSATDSPSDSLHDDDMDDFRRSVLVDSPVSLSVSPGVIALSPSLPDHPVPASSAPVRKGVGGKKGRKKKDPNEPQKPVSAYALFFRDTQAAIKGQNPNATFGEVSKIVASMWDSLGEEQKQVYKRKTEAARKEYLKALAAYKASQLTQQPTIEVLDAPPSPPPAPPVAPPPAPTPAAPAPRSSRIPVHAPDNNTITNICTSNIILDLPQVTTRSRTGAHKPPPPAPPTHKPPAPPTVSKIIISRQQLQSPRQPPPLQQMQNTPPPPRLQQMVHSQAPPPLLAKPRGAAALAGQVVATAPPPPLQIKIVPQSDASAPIIVTPLASSAAAALEVPPPAAIVATLSPSATEDAPEEAMEVELSVSPAPADAPSVCVCVRAGCNNPPIESKDWDREYCSNECVATHCRDVFMAWCAIRGQNSTTVT